MRLFRFTTAAALLAATSMGSAQFDVEIVLPGSTVSALTADAGTEFDTIGVHPSGSPVYLFESRTLTDGIVKWDGTTATIFATENDLSHGTTSASAGDMDVDAAGNLYARIFQAGIISPLWAIPPAGFGSAVEMIAPASNEQLNQIAVDANNSRLILSYNDAFGAIADEKIATVALNASGATPTDLISETALETVLSGITGYTDDTSDDLNMYDVTVQSDGDIIFSHGFTSTRPINGSLIRVTETGTASVFMTGADIKTAAGVDPNAVNIGSVCVETLSQDEILILVLFTSSGGILAPFVGVVSADGSSMTYLASDATLGADTDVVSASLVPMGESLFRMDSKASIQVASNDDLFIFRQGVTHAPANDAVLVIHDIRAFLTPSFTNDLDTINITDQFNVGGQRGNGLNFDIDGSGAGAPVASSYPTATDGSEYSLYEGVDATPASGVAFFNTYAADASAGDAANFETPVLAVTNVGNPDRALLGNTIPANTRPGATDGGNVIVVCDDGGQNTLFFGESDDANYFVEVDVYCYNQSAVAGNSWTYVAARAGNDGSITGGALSVDRDSSVALIYDYDTLQVSLVEFGDAAASYAGAVVAPNTLIGSPLTVTGDAWHTFLLEVDGTTATGYVDGTLVATGTISVATGRGALGFRDGAGTATTDERGGTFDNLKAGPIATSGVNDWVLFQ